MTRYPTHAAATAARDRHVGQYLYRRGPLDAPEMTGRRSTAVYPRGWGA